MSDHALMQDRAFAQALRLCGQTPVILPSGHLVLYRRLFGMPAAMLPRATPPNDLTAQLGFVGLERTPLILSPDTADVIKGAMPLRCARTRVLLHLEVEDTAARAKLHSKWRNQLRQAENSGLRVYANPFVPDKDRDVIILEQQQARARGYSNWPAALTAAFASSAPHQTQLFKAKLNGQIVAHMLFLTHGRHASYHIGHTTAVGRKSNAHNLLLWRGARSLAAQGFATLDLGLLDKRNVGLNRFKLRAGAQMQKTGGSWLYWRPFSSRLCARLHA